MEFEAHTNVPADTPADNPITERIPVAHGIITWVSFLFPAGCHNMVHARLRHHEQSIFPSSEAMSIIGDRNPVEWNDYYELYSKPYELKFEGWSPGTTHDHVVTVRLAILPRKAVRGLAIIDALEKFLGLVFKGKVSGSSQVKVE